MPTPLLPLDPGDLAFAYGSNGLADHRLPDALSLLADEGYAGIALTLDHQHLDPEAADVLEQAARIRRQLEDHGLRVVVETGGRFVLDPRAKHQPTLVSAEGAPRRVDFYLRALEVCAVLGSPVLHLWSGVADAAEDPAAPAERLREGLSQVLDAARDAHIPLALEPEPGHVIDTLDSFEELVADLGDHPALQLTLDVGHCRCLEPQPESACIARVADRLAHVQIEDMRRGVHEHLPFGEGEVDVRGALQALADISYRGLVSVELTRHSHTAHTMVPAAIAHLRSEARKVGRP